MAGLTIPVELLDRRKLVMDAELVAGLALQDAVLGLRVQGFQARI